MTFTESVAARAAEAAAAATGPTGSPRVTAAAAVTVLDVTPDSRRVAASTVHINGAASGASPPEPEPNQDSRSAPIPLTELDAAAARAGASMTTGAAAAGATETEYAGVTTAGEELLTAAVDTSTATGADWGVCTRETRDEPLFPAAGVLSGL